MTRLSPRLAGFIALAVLTAGCGSGTETPEATSPASDASPSSPTTSATPTPSAKPKPWEVKSKAGAEAFAQMWVDVLYGAQMGDIQPFRDLSDGCELCDSIANQYQEVYDAGGKVTSTPYRVTESHLQPDGNARRHTIFLAYSAGKVKWVRRSGGPTEVFSGKGTEQLLEVQWRRGAWRATALIDFAAPG